MIAKVLVMMTVLVALTHGGLIGEIGLGSGLGLNGGISSIGIQGIALAGKQTVVDLIAPPKYEYKYAVEDPHTGDLKEQQESRIDDLTKSEYAVAEKDRKIQVSRIIGKSIPLVSKSISLGKY
ncbi:adult-specific cuticular protein ACP-20-like [Diabrotica virgifera virgifera]|uniref:Uncharacterized protein n=1 Tax=Diabrotica virgifera virgifera TaxID=50390 RepID=A0ABM5KYW5_DIAVI|nr:adult-specific cuticular protein ACP-20-like [Diabrotica virgifera virgifera]